MHLREAWVALCITALLKCVAGDLLQHWSAAAAKTRSNVIWLTDQTFDQLISTERNYTAIVCFTALQPQYQCGLCRDFDPMFSIVAYSWRSAHPNSDGVFFAKLDFPEGKEIFARYGIQSAPNVLVFPRTSSSDSRPIVYDFPKSGIQAEPFHKFLQTSVNLPPFPLVRLFNWMKLYVNLIFIFALVVLGKYAWPMLRDIMYDKNIWAVTCIITILMFTSGHMFNSIKHTPFVTSNGRGGLNYIIGGFQNQLGVETQIVASLYGLLALTTVCLAVKTHIIQNPLKQLIAIWASTAGILFMYSLLIYIFRIKNGGYPFKLFL